MTRVAAVIGDPIDHSLSPVLHAAAFKASGIDGVLVPLRVMADDIAPALAGLRALGFVGASVTVPHKASVAALCDRLVVPAQPIGAVNCVTFADGETVGHNTDAGGFADALAEAGFDASGQRCILLGGGGAARAAAAGRALAGCAPGTVVARAPARVSWAAAQPWTSQSLERLLADASLLVDCTSSGLSAEREAALPAPVPIAAMAPTALVATLVYHRETALLTAAAARGLATLDGASMLLHQGARAFHLWTGIEPPIEAMRTALRTALSR